MGQGFLISCSCSQIVRCEASLGCLTAWRPQDSQTNHIANGLSCKDSSAQFQSCITVSDLAPEGTSLSPGEAQAHPDLRSGHWIPSLDSRMTCFRKNMWDGSYWYGHLWKKHFATVCPLAAIIHISPTCKICFCPSDTLWKFSSHYGFRLRLNVEGLDI